jgi:hypothetical protein
LYSKIKRYEHQSGLTQALVAAVPKPMFLLLKLQSDLKLIEEQLTNPAPKEKSSTTVLLTLPFFLLHPSNETPSHYQDNHNRLD